MWRFLFSLIALGGLLAGGGTPAPSSFDKLRVHDPIQHGNLTIFPISNGGGADTSGFLTLDEGLSQGTVKVGELGALRGTGTMVRPIPGRPIPPIRMQADAAQVNELAIQNLSDKPLLLLAGELVSGGKQDRVVARDRIVPPYSEPVPLGVFCVEPGRWRGLSAEFAAAKSMAHPNLRKQVTEAKDQQKVWAEVAQSRETVAAALAPPPSPPARASGGPAAVGGAGGAASGVVGGILADSSSYARTMEARPVQDKLGEQVRPVLNNLPKGTIGVVVAVNGQAAWADLFASPALFERYRAKLLQSYLVEGFRFRQPTAKTAAVADARDFLRSMTGRQTIEVEPNLYRLVRTEVSGIVTYELQALGAHEATLHVARMTSN